MEFQIEIGFLNLTTTKREYQFVRIGMDLSG